MSESRVALANDIRRRAETQIAAAGWLTARDLLEQALAIYREEAHGAGKAACLRGLGDVALKLEDPEGASAHYACALEAARASGDPLAEAECLYREGDLLRTVGRAPEAAARLADAAEAYRRAGHRRGEAECRGLLGEIARARGAPEAEALGHYREAQRLQMEAGDLKGAAITLTFVAGFLKERDAKAAAEAFVQAARIYEGLGLVHRADPLLAAARRLDPEGAPPLVPRRPGPWDTDD